MAHLNPTLMTGEILLGDLLAPPSSSLITNGTIESATVISNQNNTLLLECNIHETELPMMCFTNVINSNASEESGYLNIVIKEIQNITKFIIQVKSYNVSDVNIILMCLFVKNDLEDSYERKR